MSIPQDTLVFCHSDGWQIEVRPNDVLGRSNGPHTAQLSRIPVISGNHARVTRQGSDWFITDLNSTNKTFVNGIRLEPNIPSPVKPNDVVMLANAMFTLK